MHTPDINKIYHVLKSAQEEKKTGKGDMQSQERALEFWPAWPGTVS